MTDVIVALARPEAAAAERFGPKAANLAALGHAGLPIPDGFCVDAAAYREQLRFAALEDIARGVFGSDDPARARRCALDMKLGLMEQPLAPAVLEPLVAAYRELSARCARPVVVRSSALVEDRYGSSFAGQFESYLGLENEADFLVAVRACWTALWSTRALRYMATHDIDPAATAMAVLIQPLVAARAAGGGLSRTADGNMLINATSGLGSAIAQGEVTPDRYVLSREGALTEAVAGPGYHALNCSHRQPMTIRRRREAPRRCLSDEQVSELARLLLQAEALMGRPVEIEWALDDRGIQLLQSRPLHLQPENDIAVDEDWSRQPRLRGQPAGAGWASGPACVVNCECELSRVAPGTVLVTRMAGPALSQVLAGVAGVVAELGGSTSHLASLARERGIPMVLGVTDATASIPDGSIVAVDGVSGIVRWRPDTGPAINTGRW
ncbi:MAG TPA: PEP/pyruvate-binding domain-containing protein [Burkholderiales bacterium]|nr:PEP/pyruvate-binding domain-containing protein [Burkholderiales bacterium]